MEQYDPALFDHLMESIGHWPGIHDLQDADVHGWLRKVRLDAYIEKIGTATSAESTLRSVIADLWEEPGRLHSLINYLLKYIVTSEGPDRDILTRCEHWVQAVELLEQQESGGEGSGLTYTKFLSHHGLLNDSGHPFVKADNELIFFQLDPFSLLTGPNHLFVFAPRGYGKTSMRQAVADFIRTGKSHSSHPRPKPKRGLVVDINQTELLRVGPIEKECHDLIMRDILGEVHKQLNNKIRLWQRLGQRGDRLIQYLALAQFFLGPAILVPQQFSKYAPQIEQQISRYRTLREGGMGFEFHFDELLGIVEQLDFSSIYLMVDDPNPVWLSNLSRDSMQRALQHIIISGIPAASANGNGAYHNPDMHVVWKFFLNDRYRTIVEDLTSQIRAYVRFHPLPKRTNEELVKIVDDHLTYYASRAAPGNTSCSKQLSDLCDVSDEKPLEDLASCAGGSPRAMIELIEQLFLTHCAEAQSREYLIPEHRIRTMIEVCAKNGGSSS